MFYNNYNNQIFKIMQQNPFINITYNFNLFSLQLYDDFSQSSFSEQYKDSFNCINDSNNSLYEGMDSFNWINDSNNSQNNLNEVTSSDLTINQNNDINLFTKEENNTTLLNNKTKREEFNSEGNNMNNGISKNINIPLFKIDIEKKTKKRGRKKNSENNNSNLTKDKTIHTKMDDDNIIIKIKVFFLNNVHEYINGLIQDNDKKLIKIDPNIKTNLKKDYNMELWNTTFKNIYIKEKISVKYSEYPGENKKIIDEIYEKNSDNDEIIKILNLTFGEVFEIFIKDLKELNPELLTKVENYEIYKNVEFSNLDKFYNKIKEKEKKDGQSDESIKDYINTIKENCKNFKAWFEDKKGRERKKKTKEFINCYINIH